MNNFNGIKKQVEEEIHLSEVKIKKVIDEMVLKIPAPISSIYIDVKSIDISDSEGKETVFSKVEIKIVLSRS